MTDACPPDGELERLLTDQMTTGEKQTLAVHVAGCATCQLRLEQFDWGGRTLRPGEIGSANEPARAVSQPPGPSASAPEEAASPPDAPKPVDPPTVPAPPGRIPAPSAVFGRYQVRRILGSGGFGAVYLAHDTQLDRPVAIKVLRGGSGGAQADNEQSLQEARKLARLRHPGIVTVHDVGVHEGHGYLVSDHLDGPDLSSWLRSNRPPWTEAARIAAAVADALAHAHARLVVHRDVKSTNIILTADRMPVLVDFGLALDEGQAGGRERGIITGTLHYMSPEQAMGLAHRLDGRTDIYSLGVVLYEMLTGRLPFQSADTRELLRQVRDDEPQPPRQLVHDIPPELETACLKALAKRQQDRYTTAADFAEDLRRVLRSEDSPQRTQRKTERKEQQDTSSPVLSALSASSAVNPLLRGEGAEREVPISPSSRRRAQEAERRQVTVLVCGSDLFESEAYLEGLDAEDQAGVLRAFQQVCQETVRPWAGTIVQCNEQGLLVCFGYPVAYEDGARRAARASLGICEDMKPLSEQLQREHKLQLNPWVCLHTGSAVVEARDEAVSLVGEARNVAVRLKDVAVSGRIICTEATQRLIRGGFNCVSLGQRKIKGTAQPIELFQVEGVSGTRSPIEAVEPAELTPLTGRDHEISLLKDRWEQAQEGMGQVVLLIGEPGLGKSRLVHVMKQHIRSLPPLLTPPPSPLPETERGSKREEPLTPNPSPQYRGRPAGHGDCGEGRFGLPLSVPGRGLGGGVLPVGDPVIEWRCSPHFQNTGLHPACEFFEQLLGFGQEGAVSRFAQLVHHLEEYGLAQPDLVPLFASLLSVPLDDRFAPLGLSPVREREETFRALREWLRAYSRAQPILFIIEDLHWVDASTLEFLEKFLAEGLHDRILTLLTFRPEFHTPWPALAHQTSLALTRLNRRQVGALMRSKMGDKLPETVVEQIYDRTGGVPLFVEEFTKMVQDAGALEQTRDPGRTLLPREIPATLQDLLMARLDRVVGDREIAQLAATLGREFSYELLAAVAVDPDTAGMDEPALQAELTRLAQAEILYPKGRPPCCTWIFKHALLEDALYNAMIKSTRQQFHRRIAEVLEARFGQIAETQPELLAHHFTEAGLTNKAIGYWLKAGLKSRERFANVEAIGHLTRGLDLLATLAESPQRDAQELQLLNSLGSAYQSERGYATAEVEPIFRRACELSKRIGQPHQVFVSMWGNFAFRVVRGEFRPCMDLAAEVMDFAEQLKDPGILMEALFLQGLTLLYRGDFTGARVRCARALADFDNRERTKFWAAHTGQDAGVTHRCYLSLALWHLGYPDQALAVNREMLALARAIEHPFSLEYALHHTAWLHQRCRLPAAVEAAAAEELRIATEQGFIFWRASATLYQAAGLLLRGRVEEGLPVLREGLAAYRATGSGLALPHYLGMLGDAYTQAGRFTEARQSLTEGLALAEKNDDRCQEAELHRLEGELLLAESPTRAGAAEDRFRQAIDIARGQQSRAWQLRATMSLARLWQQQERRAEAHDALAAIYAAFTEGFTTPDLVDAKALLASLA